MQNTNLFVIFTTGLLTGGLSCLAVQGGLLATTIAQREEEKYLDKEKSKGAAGPILFFLLAKLAAYTLLGFLLGGLGSLFQISLKGQTILQVLVGLFMLGTALALLDVHPIFRYFIIQPPKFLTKRIRNQSKSKDVFAPAILGAFTVFIPCGTTQAMMALAIASGRPHIGAAVMFAFILGTSPLFFILGYFASRLGEFWHKKFLKVAAVAIIILALFNLNNTIALTGSSWTFGKIVKASLCSLAYCKNNGNGPEQDAVAAAVSEQTITIENSGYAPNSFTVKAGSEVTLHLVNTDGYSCAQAFTIPKLNIKKIVRPGSSETIQFTAPKEKGQIAFMCSMGMYRGVINVN